jgi:uncharacterized protein (TIGR03083 family)
MSRLAVDGFRAERDAILGIAHSLSEHEWELPSDCAGWTVRDVVAHMGGSLHGVLDPSYMPQGGSLDDPEALMELGVAQRRAWTLDEIIEEYALATGQALDVFASFQEPPLADTMIPMGKLGTHPMSMVPATFLFDHYCHLRVDLLAPIGPIDRTEPPRDEQRLRPTVEWMLAGLPAMCEDDLGFVDRPVVLRLDGPGGGTWTIQPPADDQTLVRVVDGDTGDGAASVVSTDHDFVIWGTQRRPWRDYVDVSGDVDYAARVLDGVNII